MCKPLVDLPFRPSWLYYQRSGRLGRMLAARGFVCHFGARVVVTLLLQAFW